MHVRVRPWPRLLGVFVLMMFIVLVGMIMHHGLVGVQVGVPLDDMQPDAHQGRGSQQARRDRIAGCDD